MQQRVAIHMYVRMYTGCDTNPSDNHKSSFYVFVPGKTISLSVKIKRLIFFTPQEEALWLN